MLRQRWYVPSLVAFVSLVASLALVTPLVVGPAGGQSRMPRTLVWTAYDVGSAGYSQAASIGNAMQQKQGITLRVIPAGNDVARQIPMLRRTAQFGALGSAFFLSQEGVMDFSAPEWGPQPVRILGAAWANFNTGAASCAGDIGIKTVYDLKGKRIAWVVGGPALNLNMTAYLAAGNLGWNDVQKLDFPAWGASARAVIEGKADCFIANTNSGPVYELANSPRKYSPAAMPDPKKDPAAWQRLRRWAPYFEPNLATIGAPPVSKDSPVMGGTYGYPIITTYDFTDAELVYQQTRMVYDLFPVYRDAWPGNEGFALEAQRLMWVAPYHEGAVRYFKEKKVWTDEMEKHNQNLLRRQEVLAAAWSRAQDEAQKQKVGAAKFPDLWMKIRAEDLKKAGLDPYWETKFW
ncbi:MAG TPA: TAXI family TRAP transporter solute-binding subunit [Candidatus Tectomicrobia bacterium]|nr:TAXI family TRAP transporter solute-binding subunit [Candidatus Tectomicrobia bacterium]